MLRSIFTRWYWMALAVAFCAACNNPSAKVPPDSALIGIKTFDSQVNVPDGPCVPCLVDSDCASARCIQHDGDWVCAAECDSPNAAGVCAADTTCVSATTAEGGSVQVCVPPPGTCSSTTDDADAAADIDNCPWDSPGTPGCCVCTGANCQANGCLGGWYCQRETCKCHSPHQAPVCVKGDDAAAVGSDLPIRLDFSLEKLDFAIVGDTRPPIMNGTKYYPTPIIAKIWQEVAKEVPTVPFAVTTGDYVFASAYGSQGAIQLDLYLTARAHFTRPVWYTLGNHECAGATASNRWGLAGRTIRSGTRDRRSSGPPSSGPPSSCSSLPMPGTIRKQPGWLRKWPNRRPTPSSSATRARWRRKLPG